MGAFGEMLIRNFGGDLDAYRGDKPKQKEMKKEELIGKEVYGFKFPDGHAGLSYPEAMNNFVGKVGIVWDTDERSVKVIFPKSRHRERNYWYYPKSMVIVNLVTEASEKKELSKPEIFKIL